MFGVTKTFWYTARGLGERNGFVGESERSHREQI